MGTSLVGDPTRGYGAKDYFPCLWREPNVQFCLTCVGSKCSGCNLKFKHHKKHV